MKNKHFNVLSIIKIIQGNNKNNLRHLKLIH